MKHKIVLLAGQGESSRIVYHYLKKKFEIVGVVQEKGRKDRFKIFKRRWKRLGPVKVIGQTLFTLLVARYLKSSSTTRIEEIYKEFGLDNSPIPDDIIIKVENFNSEETIEKINFLRPEAAVLNGTRIISRKVLEGVKCKFINTHVGVTPKYRGVHGGYWALVNGDQDNCGVTVHYVDEGIDTGAVIHQERIHVTNRDNFATYTLLQLGKALSLLEDALIAHINGTVKTSKGTSDSKLYYHPTFYEYFKYRFLKGVK